MTNQYLLAAEADKIQDFVFRAAHLREVVGGSQLLARFCAEAPGPLGVTHRSDLVVHAGGSFRILFPTEDAACRFGGQLAELYRLAADGTLTVADPIPVTGDYGDAAAAAEEALRRAKRRRAGAETSPHLPIIAFCTNCGAGLATAHKLRHAKDETPQYLCAACQAKAAERAGERRAGLFLGSFYAAVAGIEIDPVNGAQEALNAADLLQWPGRTPRLDGGEHDPVEDVADYDDRRYVAYLVADGNNLGEIFGLCRTAAEVSTLSTSLDAIVRRALAAPTKLAMRQEVRPGRHAPHALVPVLPLILGGDDVFVLLPAPWALDFALRFCREYEQQMAELLRGPQFEGLRSAYAERTGRAELQPTMAAAVVICKASHPYAQAHAAGHACLHRAKHAARLLAAEQPEAARSAVDFAVILGGQLAPTAGDGRVRPTLRPYWSGSVPAGWGLPLDRLIAQRGALRPVPNTRLAQLRDLFDPPLLPHGVNTSDLAAWRRQQEYLLGRLARRGGQLPGSGAANGAGNGGDGGDNNRTRVEAALAALGAGRGDHPAAPWYGVLRPDETWYGQGLPDLLEAWDYALDLDVDRAQYLVEA